MVQGQGRLVISVQYLELPRQRERGIDGVE